MRCVIIGPSGSRKTNILINILAHMKLPKDIYLCTKTAIQEKFKLLNMCKKSIINIIDVVDNLPDPNEVPVGSIIIFDDILPENQQKMAEFSLGGRINEITCFYFTQSYTKTPKKSAIRNNFNYLMLLDQDVTNLREIYKESIWAKILEIGMQLSHFLCDLCQFSRQQA